MRLLNKAVSLIFPMAPAIQAYIKLLTVPRGYVGETLQHMNPV